MTNVPYEYLSNLKGDLDLDQTSISCSYLSDVDGFESKGFSTQNEGIWKFEHSVDCKRQIGFKLVCKMLTTKTLV